MIKKLADLPLGNIEGLGSIGNTNVVIQNRFTGIISSILGLLTVAGGLWFVFQLFAGALSWIAAGNDKQALENSKKKITHALIGLVIVVTSYTLIGVVGYVFGIDLINLESLITNVAIK